jgi:hypothetical protein
MPYKLRKAPRKDLYWVITIETGKKHSKDPIPKDKAQAQKRILEQALGKLAGGINIHEYKEFLQKYYQKKLSHQKIYEQWHEFEALLTQEQKDYIDSRASRDDVVNFLTEQLDATMEQGDLPNYGSFGSLENYMIMFDSITKNLAAVYYLISNKLNEKDFSGERVAFEPQQSRGKGKVTQARIAALKTQIDALTPKFNHYVQQVEAFSKRTGQSLDEIYKTPSGKKILALEEKINNLVEKYNYWVSVEKGEASAIPEEEEVPEPTNTSARSSGLAAIRMLRKGKGKKTGAGHKSTLKKEYNRIMRNPRLTPQQRHDVKSIFDATNLKLTKLGKSNPILNRLVGIPANQQINSEKNKLVDAAIRRMDTIAPITLFQQRNPLSSEMTRGAVNLVDEYEERLANENPVNPMSQTELDENPLSGQGMRGKAMPEGLDILQQIAKESYNLENPKENIGGWILKKWTPTLKFYMKGNDVIVGVRGTIPTNSEDVSADLTIPFNGIPSTMRFKRDKASMQQFQQEYPTSQYNYFGVGHSLGGAVIDTMLRQKFIKEAVSYNPAIQYSDINGGLANRRIYYGSDPLYRLMGWWDKKSEHREPENRSWADFLGKFNPAAAVVAGLPAHNLINFEGGKKCRKCGLRK